MSATTTATVDKPKAQLISLDFDLGNALEHCERVKSHGWDPKSQVIVDELLRDLKIALDTVNSAFSREGELRPYFEKHGLVKTVQQCEDLHSEYYTQACDRRYARDTPGYDRSREQQDANVDLLDEYLWERSKSPSCRIAVEELKVDCQALIDLCYIPSSDLPTLSASESIRRLPSKKLDGTTKLEMRSKVPDELVLYHHRPTRIAERLLRLWMRSLPADRDEQDFDLWEALENLLESGEPGPDRPDASDEVQRTVNHTLKTLARHMPAEDDPKSPWAFCLSLAWNACRAREGSLSALAQDPRSTAPSELPLSL